MQAVDTMEDKLQMLIRLWKTVIKCQAYCNRLRRTNNLCDNNLINSV